jgi:hypothetical protein
MNDHENPFWEIALIALVVVAAIVKLFKKKG